MALPDRKPQELVGWPKPRIGPPAPLRHGLVEYRKGAKDLDIEPMPWQDMAAMYLTALGPETCGCTGSSPQWSGARTARRR